MSDISHGPVLLSWLKVTIEWICITDPTQPEVGGAIVYGTSFCFPNLQPSYLNTPIDLIFYLNKKLQKILPLNPFTRKADKNEDITLHR